MTATSVFPPTATTRSWNAVQRAAVVLILLVVVAAAFAGGRATVHARHTPPAIAAVSVPVPSASGSVPLVCRIGRPC